jgi:hypothetical protein
MYFVLLSFIVRPAFFDSASSCLKASLNINALLLTKLTSSHKARNRCEFQQRISSAHASTTPYSSVHRSLTLSRTDSSAGWLIDYDGMRLCLRTVDSNGTIFHSPGNMWAWRPWWWWCRRLGITPDSYTRDLWQSYQQTSGESRRNWRGVKILPIQYLRYLKGSSTCCKILRHGTSGFTSPPKERCCGFLSPLSIHRLGRVWISHPWIQWQAHYSLHHRGDG